MRIVVEIMIDNNDNDNNDGSNNSSSIIMLWEEGGVVWQNTYWCIYDEVANSFKV